MLDLEIKRIKKTELILVRKFYPLNIRKSSENKSIFRILVKTRNNPIKWDLFVTFIQEDYPF
jgi:hypothetical protein